jgi:hypothetical protein
LSTARVHRVEANNIEPESVQSICNQRSNRAGFYSYPAFIPRVASQGDAELFTHPISQLSI